MDDNQPGIPEFGFDKATRFRGLFFEEAAELIQAAELCLQKSANGAGDEETAGTLFRSVHSIKSGAAAFGMRRVVSFAHVFESTLEELRCGSYMLDNIRRHMFLRCYDMLAGLLDDEAGHKVLPENAEAELIKAMEGLIGLAVTLRIDTNTQKPASSFAMPVPMPIQSTTIRVELTKIDRLMNLAGELMVIENSIRQSAKQLLANAGESSDQEGSMLQRNLDQLALRIRDLSDHNRCDGTAT